VFIFKAVLKDLGCTEYKKNNNFRPGYHLVPYIAKVKKNFLTHCMHALAYILWHLDL